MAKKNTKAPVETPLELKEVARLSNIRSTPNLNAKKNIVRVVEPGTILKAKETKGEWTVLDDGTYIRTELLC